MGVVVGLAAVICLMLLAFSAPPMHSGPHDLPLAVSGPAPAVDGLQDALDEKSPRGFEVAVHSHGDEVTRAIENREAVGGISITPEGVEVKTASAAGVPYVTVLRNIGDGLAAEGMTVTVTDVVRLTDDDPTGAGIAALGLPLAIGGTISAALLATLFRQRTLPRVTGSIAFAGLTGMATTAVLHWLGAVDGDYWATAAVVGLGIAAISLTVLGLESLLGYAGIAAGALLMVFVANPLSALATGPAWLPQPWGDIGQLLPIGAAGTVIRSSAFFGGAGSERALVVLGAWIVLGLVLLVVSASRSRGLARRHGATSESNLQMAIST
jgi:hypothetical protein